ncbi:MAG: peroxiredoxin family protein [Acidobacteria bacterium]|nr:peroxiredoxin family protein [Acidobacteriota bacterium]
MPSHPPLLTFLSCAFLLSVTLLGAGEEGSHPHGHDGVPEKFPTHPAAGDPAPEFSLKDTDGKPLALGEYLGRGYLILAFGSASSSNFRKSAPDLDRLSREWERMEVKVLVIYTREAHPAVLRSTAPKSYRDRELLARQTRKDLKVNLRFLVDQWDDGVHKSYGAMPDGAFLLDPKGVIVSRQVQVRASSLDRELRRLLKVPDPAPERPD